MPIFTPRRILDRGAGIGAAMNYAGIITVEPGKRGGKPCIRGMRITVSDVLDYLAGGMSEDDIRACLAFAAERALAHVRGRPVT